MFEARIANGHDRAGSAGNHRSSQGTWDRFGPRKRFDFGRQRTTALQSQRQRRRSKSSPGVENTAGERPASPEGQRPRRGLFSNGLDSDGERREGENAARSF